jgi:hypothetical protein
VQNASVPCLYFISSRFILKLSFILYLDLASRLFPSRSPTDILMLLLSRRNLPVDGLYGNGRFPYPFWKS